MSHALTENAASANFGSGLVVPDNGDDFTASCAVVVAAAQQLADRSQLVNGYVQTRVRVPLITNFNNNSRFAVVNPTDSCFWQQTDVTSFGGLLFSLGNIPSGRTISSITAYVLNPNTTTLPIGTQPTLQLHRYSHSLGTLATIATVSDTTAVLATYNADHALTLSGINHVIIDDYEYSILVTGETGANAVAGFELTGLVVNLTY